MAVSSMDKRSMDDSSTDDLSTPFGWWPLHRWVDAPMDAVHWWKLPRWSFRWMDNSSIDNSSMPFCWWQLHRFVNEDSSLTTVPSVAISCHQCHFVDDRYIDEVDLSVGTSMTVTLRTILSTEESSIEDAVWSMVDSLMSFHWWPLHWWRQFDDVDCSIY